MCAQIEMASEEFRIGIHEVLINAGVDGPDLSEIVASDCQQNARNENKGNDAARDDEREMFVHKTMEKWLAITLTRAKTAQRKRNGMGRWLISR